MPKDNNGDIDTPTPNGDDPFEGFEYASDEALARDAVARAAQEKKYITGIQNFISNLSQFSEISPAAQAVLVEHASVERSVNNMLTILSSYQADDFENVSLPESMSVIPLITGFLTSFYEAACDPKVVDECEASPELSAGRKELLLKAREIISTFEIDEKALVLSLKSRLGLDEIDGMAVSQGRLLEEKEQAVLLMGYFADALNVSDAPEIDDNVDEVEVSPRSPAHARVIKPQGDGVAPNSPSLSLIERSSSGKTSATSSPAIGRDTPLGRS